MHSISKIQKNVPPLHALGLLTDDDVTRIDDLIRKAHDATAVKKNHDVLRRQAIADAARSVVTATDIAAAISKASAKVPGDTVPAIADAVHNAAIDAAAAIAFGRRGEIPAILTEHFDTVAAEALAAADELGHVRTAQAAIDHGVIDLWKRLDTARERYAGLEALRSNLRLDGVIATAGTASSGSHWSFRLPVDEDAAYWARNANDDGLSYFLYVVARQPYCPANSDEANAVLDTWPDGQAVA